MVDWLPRAAQEVVLLNPIVHCVEMLRDGYFGSTVRTHYDIGYVFTFSMIVSLLALMFERDASRRVLPE